MDEAASVFWVYYKWMGRKRAAVALRRGVDGWGFARVAGFGNASLPDSTERTIRDVVVRALGPPAAEPVTPVPETIRGNCFDGVPASQGVLAYGRSLFSHAERAKAVSVLRAIQGRSLPRGNRAFCVLEFSPYYAEMGVSPIYSLAVNVRQRRSARRMTQEALAKHARVARSYIAMIEAARIKGPRPAVLERLARALGTTAPRLTETPPG